MATTPAGTPHAHPPTRNVRAAIHTAITVLGLAALAGGCAGSRAADDPARSAPRWSLTGTNAVSKPVTWAGVTAVTALAGRRLRTVALDMASGKRLWEQPAAMAGRPAAMGVQPPAVTGTPGHVTVVAVEPGRAGGRAALVARDARTGAQRWTRPVRTTLGPVRCGQRVCLSESTGRPGARFVALDAGSGRRLWQVPGVADVAWTGGDRVVLFDLAGRPTLTARALGTGKALWAYPVERAVGRRVNVSGGWTFGSLSTNTDGTLVGYLGPHQRAKGARLTPFGAFALRLRDGRPLWARPRLLRVYPSANPAVALVVREVDRTDRYGPFAVLDPRTGATVARLPIMSAPAPVWGLAFPRDLSTLGFLARGKPGGAYDMGSGRRVVPRGRSWSFCAARPAPLPLAGRRGFYPVAALCPFDLTTGRPAAGPAEPPPAWYTGSVDGWRIWRDGSGVLHGSHDGHGTVPGMYGQ